jgi:hypothetical protein
MVMRGRGRKRKGMRDRRNGIEEQGGEDWAGVTELRCSVVACSKESAAKQ